MAVVAATVVLLALTAVLMRPNAATQVAAMAVLASALPVVLGPWALATVRTGNENVKARRVVGWFGAGSVLWLLADSAHLVMMVTDGPADAIRMLRFGHIAAGGLFLVGALAIPGRSRRITSARGLIDGLLIAIVATFIIFSGFALAPVDRDWIAPFVISTLVGGGIIGICLAIATHRMVLGRVWMLLGAAATTAFIIDALQWRTALLDEPISLTLSWGWVLASLLRGAAAADFIAGSRALIQVGRPSRRLARTLPVLALAAGLFALYLTPGRTASTICTVMVIALMACVVVRHVLREVEESRLAGQVHRATLELSKRADHDDLTGLLRRDAGFDRLRTALDQRGRDGGLLGVAFIDVDGFKAVNDQFGHSIGDQLLVAIADRLNRISRAGDSVVRFGGDEFLVIRPTLTAGDDRWADRIRLAIREPMEVSGIPMRVTASVGFVVSEGGQTPAGELVKHADHAAYRAKRAGRNQLSGLDMRRPVVVEANVQQAAAVVAALASGELRTWYQPIVDLATNRMVGAEALTRWVSPDGEVRTAGDFVPDLIAAGHGPELTSLVLRQGCADFASGLPARFGWILSVNVTARDLLDPQLIDRLSAELHRSGLEAHRLQIEIDEHTDPSGPISRVLERISELGIRIALDDFGASSSTFGQMAVLAPTTLKLDKGLLHAMTAATAPAVRAPAGCPRVAAPNLGPAQQSVVGAFASLAHHLSMTVVAEGVETVEQRNLIEALGCDQGQGFLWSRAVPFEQLCRIAGDGHLVPEPVDVPLPEPTERLDAASSFV